MPPVTSHHVSQQNTLLSPLTPSVFWDASGVVDCCDSCSASSLCCRCAPLFRPRLGVYPTPSSTAAALPRGVFGFTCCEGHSSRMHVGPHEPYSRKLCAICKTVLKAAWGILAPVCLHSWLPRAPLPRPRHEPCASSSRFQYFTSRSCMCGPESSSHRLCES